MFSLSPTEGNRDILERSGFFEKCGKEWIFPSIQDAVHHAQHESMLVSTCAFVTHNYIPYSGKFFASINFCKSPTRREKISQFLFSRQDTMSDHTPYNFPHGNVVHIVCFQRQNDSKISTLIKVCQLLLPKRCHAKGRELTLRIYSQLRRVDHRSRKISTVCSMLLRQNTSNFCRFTGSASQRHCAQLVSKKCLEENFSREQTFMSWCLIAKIAKISTSQKFPAIR